jgi:hypothetical protein
MAKRAKRVVKLRCPVGTVPTATVKVKRTYKGKRTYLVRFGRCVPIKCACSHGGKQ